MFSAAGFAVFAGFLFGFADGNLVVEIAIGWQTGGFRKITGSSVEARWARLYVAAVPVLLEFGSWFGVRVRVVVVV